MIERRGRDLVVCRELPHGPRVVDGQAVELGHEPWLDFHRQPVDLLLLTEDVAPVVGERPPTKLMLKQWAIELTWRSPNLWNSQTWIFHWMFSVNGP